MSTGPWKSNAALSAAQLEVLMLLAQNPDMKAREIGNVLFLGVSAVEWRLRGMYQALGVHGNLRGKRRLAIEAARNLGLIPKVEE